MILRRGILALFVACLATAAASADDGRALAELKGLAGDASAPGAATPRAAAVVSRDLGPAAQASTNFPESVTLSRSILARDLSEDADRDGLADAVEGELADAFRPFLIFDSRENARRPDEPVVAFQVRPVGCVGPRPKCGPAPIAVHILYNTIWRQDGGYVISRFCRDDHKGDIQVVGVRAESYDDGRTFRLSAVENWGFVWPKADARFLAGTHPWIYLSGGKHHQYFDAAIDGKPSAYSAWSCREAMDGKGEFKLAELKGPGARWNNVGEPESHPSSAFVDDLGPYGYPGESAWDARHFCGGQACDRQTNPGSRMANVWLRDPFFDATP